MDPRDLQEKLVTEIKEELAVLASGASVVNVASTLESLSPLLEALAIVHLLGGGDVERFRENLVRSGQARRYLLSRASSEGVVACRQLGLSRSDAFLDTVVSGHRRLARELHSLSLLRWDPGSEYEDDHWFFRIVQHLEAGDMPEDGPEYRNMLERFQTSLEGAKSRRLAACEALIRKDRPGFEEALVGLVEESQEHFDRKRPDVVESDLHFWPRSFVFIEGLALLKLAESRGIAPENEIPLCPSLARLGDTDAEYVDVFRQIDYELARRARSGK